MPDAPQSPIPYGWFVVALGDDAGLAAGELKALRRFGRDLILFRSAEGEAGLLDAHCPHMGVHLAQGGRVDGSLVRCPFHGWGFDAAGWCRDIPYAPQLPPRCGRGPVMHGYPVQEAGGAVWAWHHPENKAPSFPLGLEELGAPACEPIRLARNAADAAEVVAARLRRLLAPEASAGVSSVDGFAWTTPDGALTIRAHGPAKITARRQGAVLTALLTPLEAQETELQIALTAGEGGRAALTPALCGPVAQGLAEAEEPADPQFRRWLEQFLVAPTPAQMEAAE